MSKILVAFLCFVPVFCCCGDDDRKPIKHLPHFGVPKQFLEDHDFHPATYVESYPVKQVGEHLDEASKKNLKQLFIEAAKACRKKYNQDYNIETKAPIYRLLKTNFPEVSKAERERGHIVFLGDLAKILQETKDK
jgi:hypothetical protein